MNAHVDPLYALPSCSGYVCPGYVSSLSSQQGFSKAAACWWLSDSSSTQPLTPTSRHPPLALRLRTHNYRRRSSMALKEHYLNFHFRRQFIDTGRSTRFISRVENQQQQQPAANSPTKVIAVARKGSSLQYISMSWHSEKYWRYYSMKGRQAPILRRWGWNDLLWQKYSVSLLEIAIVQWGNVISSIYFRAVKKKKKVLHYFCRWILHL